MEIIPQGENILIELITYEEITKTKGGILLPEAETKPPKPVIYSFGNNVPQNDLGIGDAVLLRRHTGTDINDGEKQYKLVVLEDILATIKE